MIFFSKQKNNARQTSSSEACISIIGLFIAVGLLGGLSALIYGLIKGSSSGKIGGGIVLGVSVIAAIIFALVFIFCLKNNNTNSDENDQQSTSNRPRQRQQRRHGKHEQTTSREISHVSAVPRYDNRRPPPLHQQQQQQHTNGHNMQMYSQNPNTHSLNDSSYYNQNKQVPLSPSKVPSSIHLNQSHNSLNNPQHQLVMTSDIHPHTYQ
ncbi:hypothetical protein I4U23_018328 [Adineta vaga]|nr:hypothetical protein I4U23_018328 [Adineta vaga]